MNIRNVIQIRIYHFLEMIKFECLQMNSNSNISFLTGNIKQLNEGVCSNEFSNWKISKERPQKLKSRSYLIGVDEGIEGRWTKMIEHLKLIYF